MAIAQHRAPTDYAVATPVAALLAVALGVVVGLAIALVFSPDMQGVTTGLTYGLILGVPAAIAVVFARRAIVQGASIWAVGVGAVLTIVIVAALLFALTQVDARLAPVGAVLGLGTAVFSLYLGLRLTHTRRPAGAGVHRRSAVDRA